LKIRTQLYDNGEVEGSEFLRKVKRIAKLKSSFTADIPNATPEVTEPFISVKD
jgi:hypothetical protein